MRVLARARPVAVRAGRLLDPRQRQHERREQQADPQRRPEQRPAGDRVPAPRAADRLAGLGGHRVGPGGDDAVRAGGGAVAPAGCRRHRHPGPSAGWRTGPRRCSRAQCAAITPLRCRARRQRPAGPAAGCRPRSGRRRPSPVRWPAGVVAVGSPSVDRAASDVVVGAGVAGVGASDVVVAAPGGRRRRRLRTCVGAASVVGAGTPSPVSPLMSGLVGQLLLRACPSRTVSMNCCQIAPGSPEP